MDTRTERAATTTKLARSRTRSFIVYRNATFVSLLMGYGAYYLCRQNFSVAYAPLNADLGLSAKAFGVISSVGTLIYASGKLITGALADVRGGRLIFLVGLFGSVLASGLIPIVGFAQSGVLGVGGILLFTILWSVNRFFQSMGWVGVVNVMSRWFRPDQYGTAMGAMSISYQLGGAAGGIFAGCLLSMGLGWRALFLVPALVLLVHGLIVRRFVVNSPSDVGYRLPAGNAPSRVHVEDDPGEWSARLRVILCDRNFLLMCGLSVILTFLRECFTLWMPAYFLDMGARASAAAFKASLFSFLGCAGTLFAGWFSDRYLGARRAPIMAVLLVGLTITTLCLAGADAVADNLGVDRDLLSLLLVSAGGFLLFGPYSLVGGVAALDFGGPRTSGTAMGILDGAGHLGATAAGVGVAATVAFGGWKMAFLVMSAVTFLAVVVSAFLWRARPRT